MFIFGAILVAIAIVIWVLAARYGRRKANADDPKQKMLEDNVERKQKTFDERNEAERPDRYEVREAERELDRAKDELRRYMAEPSDDGDVKFWKMVSGIGAGILTLVGLVILVTSTVYTQDIGASKVQVSWSGQLVGQTTTPGFHLKAPWVNIRTFDVRNNTVAFVGPTEDGKTQPNYAGNVTTGPQITFQDLDGVTGNMDLTIRYSIAPDSVLDVYSDFQTQENFVVKVISEGVRAEARRAPSTRGTLKVYNDRAGLEADILAGLEARWAGKGIQIEDVAVQEIRYSKDVAQRFDDAQAARIAVDKAKADQEAAKVTAQTQVITAQGQADAAVVAAQGQSDANELLTKSLTPEVLTQRYIDALNNAGGIYVVPEGSTPFITTTK